MKWIGELYRPTIGLLGCTNPTELLTHATGPGRLLTGEMDPDEAARVAEMLGVDYAIPCHHISPTPDLDAFVERCSHHDTSGKREALIPVVGETRVFHPRGEGPA